MGVVNDAVGAVGGVGVKWYDKKGEEIGLEAYTKLFSDMSYRVVDKTELGEVHVSTVWLGLNHSWHPGPPLIFETMIFGGSYDMECWRESSEERAQVRHWNAVAAVRAEEAFAMGVGTVNEQKIQGEYYVGENVDFVGCDFQHANVHVSNGAEATFIGCTFYQTHINALETLEFHSGVAVYKTLLKVTGGEVGVGGLGIVNEALKFTIGTFKEAKLAETTDDPSPSVVTQLEEVFGRFPEVHYPCGCDNHRVERLDHVIIHLNDRHEWERERIADWVEELEEDLTVKATSKGD